MSSRFHRIAGVMSLNDNSRHRIVSFVLAQCTYCLVTRGKSPGGRRVTFTRNCFTIRAQETRVVTRQVRRVSELRTQSQLHSSRGRLSRGVCREKISSGKCNEVHSGNSATLFKKRAARSVGRELKVGSGHPLTSFLPALAVTTGGLTARVAGCGMRRGGLCKRSSVAHRRMRGGIDIQDVLKRHKVHPRRLPITRSVGGIRHHIISSSGGVRGSSSGLPVGG